VAHQLLPFLLALLTLLAGSTIVASSTMMMIRFLSPLVLALFLAGVAHAEDPGPPTGAPKMGGGMGDGMMEDAPTMAPGMGGGDGGMGGDGPMDGSGGGDCMNMTDCAPTVAPATGDGMMDAPTVSPAMGGDMGNGTAMPTLSSTVAETTLAEIVATNPDLATLAAAANVSMIFDQLVGPGFFTVFAYVSICDV